MGISFFHRNSMRTIGCTGAKTSTSSGLACETWLRNCRILLRAIGLLDELVTIAATSPLFVAKWSGRGDIQPKYSSQKGFFNVKNVQWRAGADRVIADGVDQVVHMFGTSLASVWRAL